MYQVTQLSERKLFLRTPIYNQFHNILRLFDVLPNFPFTTSEMMGDYYLLPTQDKKENLKF